jgi:AraC-like DNA-binding protein
MTLSAIAHRVGYQSPFALSFAFKREFGISPKDHQTGLTSSLANLAAYTE